MADYVLGVEITGDASGLQSEAKTAEKAVEDVAKTSESAAQRIAGSLKNAFSNLGSGVQSGLTAAGQGLTNLGGKFESAGQKMTASGKAMSLGLTAPLTGIYKFSKSAFNEVDAGMDTVVKKTGATGDALESLQGSVKNVATTIPTSFETAGQAVGEVNTRFGLTGEALDDLSGKFVKFAELNGTDVSASVDATQQIIEAFGLTTEDAGNLLDTFNKVGQDTGVNLDALMGSMIQNSAAFKEMGFGAADTAKFLGELEVSGADSSQVMAGLKKALQNAAKEGTPMNEALAQMQDSLTGAESDTEATALAMELFGSKAGPAIAKAVREGKLSFDDLGTSLTDAAGNIDTTFENTQDGADEMTLAMNRIKASSADLSDQVDKTLAPIMERLASGIEWVAQKFSELSPETQQIIVTIGLLLAVIGPLLLILGTMSTAIGGLIGANGLGGLLTALGGLSAPVLAIIAVIGVLVGVFLTLWNTNEEFRTRITEIWGQIQGAFSVFISLVSEKLASWGITWETVITFLMNLWNGFCNLLAPIFIFVFQTIADFFDFATRYILNVMDIFHGLFTGNWTEVWEAVQRIFSSAWNFIVDLFENVCEMLGLDAESLKQDISEKFNAVKDFLFNIWENIKDDASAAWELLKLLILGPVLLLCDLVTGDFEQLKEDAANIWDKMKEYGGKLWEDFKNFVIETAKSLTEGAQEKIEEIPGIVEDGFQGAIDFITGLPGEAWDWGSDIMSSLADGIWSGFSWVQDAVSSVADTIRGFLHFSEPDVGPLSDFHTYMPDMMRSLADGMKRNIPTLRAGVDLVANTMSGIIPGTGTAGRYGGDGDGGRTTNLGGVSIVVNGTEGQDEEAVADAVMRRMMELVASEV